MKKIFLSFILLVWLILTNNISFSYIYYGNYSSADSNWCESGRYWPYFFPDLTNWQSYTSTLWSTTTTLICKNWYVSIKNSISTNNNYSNITTNNYSCKSWKYGPYNYPDLTDWQKYTTTLWNTTTTLICKNWYVSIQDSYSSNTYSNTSNYSSNSSYYSYSNTNSCLIINRNSNSSSTSTINNYSCKYWYVKVWNKCRKNYGNWY